MSVCLLFYHAVHFLVPKTASHFDTSVLHCYCPSSLALPRFLTLCSVPSSSAAAAGTQVYATGGGAHKYTKLFHSSLGVAPIKLDEMDCLIRGSNFLLSQVEDEAFTFHPGEAPERRFRVRGAPFPYLLVNIGSGVSILRVDGPTSFERVDGSALGGGTFWGLGSLLTGGGDFDSILQLANGGDHRSVDMLVRDIYGQELPTTLGLDAELTASCLGKAARAPAAAGVDEAATRRADIAASLLQMVAYNIAQIACLNARLYDVERVFFAGFFIRGQPATMGAISKAVAYWGRDNVQALFLRHEGYLGAVGAFLHSLPEPSVSKGGPAMDVHSMTATSIMENFVARDVTDSSGKSGGNNGVDLPSLRAVRSLIKHGDWKRTMLEYSQQQGYFAQRKTDLYVFAHTAHNMFFLFYSLAWRCAQRHLLRSPSLLRRKLTMRTRSIS